MVFLTVYYLTTTTIATWRLRAIHQKIARALESKNSIVFLQNTDRKNNGMTLSFNIRIFRKLRNKSIKLHKLYCRYSNSARIF